MKNKISLVNVSEVERKMDDDLLQDCLNRESEFVSKDSLSMTVV